MLREATNYYAKPGRSADVLAQRMTVVDIRVRLGLPPGRVFKRVDGDGPDVRWECDFSSMDDYVRDRQQRDACPEFEAGKQLMHTLLERFERHLELVLPADGTPAARKP